MKPVVVKPKIRAFALEELAFFWNPRPWIPDIVSRFAWPGTSDVRDAIIMLDDEGGHGFLHWYPERASWGLTDKGKRWVEDLLSKAKLKRAREWKPPETEALTVVEAVQDEAPSITNGQDENLDEPEPPTLSREDELAALVLEQSEDE